MQELPLSWGEILWPQGFGGRVAVPTVWEEGYPPNDGATKVV